MPSLQEQIDAKKKEVDVLIKEVDAPLRVPAQNMQEAVMQIELRDFAEVKALAKHSDEICHVMNTVVFLLFGTESGSKDGWKSSILGTRVLSNDSKISWRFPH